MARWPSLVLAKKSKSPASRPTAVSGRALFPVTAKHAVEEDFRKCFRGLLFGKSNEIHFGEVEAHRMTINRSEKGLDRNLGITTIESSFALTLLDVVAQKPEERANLTLAILLRKLMAFER